MAVRTDLHNIALLTCPPAVQLSPELHEPPGGQFYITSCLALVSCSVHRYCKRNTVERRTSYDVDQMLINVTARNSNCSIIRSANCLPLHFFETQNAFLKKQNLTFWRRNYFFNFRTSCIQNVNNTGTKYVRIMKQAHLYIKCE